MISDFIANNMAASLPISLVFALGLFLFQKGLKRLNEQYDIYPLVLFICYWMLFSLGVFEGIGPTKNLDWIAVIGICSPAVGLLFYIASFVYSRIVGVPINQDEENIIERN